MKQKTFLACIGTRPEIIKTAAVIKELTRLKNRVVVLHTGQHGDFVDPLYQFFGIHPEYRVNLVRKSPSLASLTSALMEHVDAVISDVDPDVVLVQGDTTSALIGGLAGYYNNKFVAHIEAGLRTRERDPFPEEKNRELIARLASWHFCPTSRARRNLIDEGVIRNVYTVGNTVIDSALWAAQRLRAQSFDRIETIPAMLCDFHQRHRNRKLILVTAHRRESWGQPIRDIAKAVGILVEQHPDAAVIWPLHPNPSVKQNVLDELAPLSQWARDRICLTEPLSYQALITVLIQSHITLTDSGGIQEEASAFSVPVLVARNQTEREELVEAGGARIVGTDITSIIEAAQCLLTDDSTYHSMQIRESPFGDGRAAERIAEILTAGIMDDIDADIQMHPQFSFPETRHQAISARSV